MVWCSCVHNSGDEIKTEFYCQIFSVVSTTGWRVCTVHMVIIKLLVADLSGTKNYTIYKKKKNVKKQINVEVNK